MAVFSAGFAMCDACAGEYGSANDRRFHAQANACPQCGPRLALLDGAGASLPVDDVVREAVARIRSGQVLAIKGLGGFHLVCDAGNAGAVARLRERKARESKPFAVMAAKGCSGGQRPSK